MKLILRFVGLMSICCLIVACDENGNTQKTDATGQATTTPSVAATVDATTTATSNTN
ncbi:MAG: FKBP-type peptidyl-prolyl cis-trans isomerase, partial [Calothrix sp. SM1_7_51]|nr:FKBP-type peptidyl-prolyl cis-trans isomerase [Calothrix sp. SM1_7_51]